MAFGKRLSASAAAPSEAEARVTVLAERKETLERRRDAIRNEADALRKAIDATAERGDDASADAAALVAADAKLAALSLEITAAGRALDAARIVVAEEERAARQARLEREVTRAEAAFELAERKFKAALRSLSDTIGPMMRADRERDRALAAAGRPAPPFRPDRADDELLEVLRGADPAGVEFLQLDVPWLQSPNPAAETD